MRLLTILALFLLLTFSLTACNRSADQATDAATGQPADAADKAPADDQTAAGGADAHPPREDKPADPIVGGTWFALFGRHGNSVVEDEYENGHRVRFIEDGMALWVVVEKGWDKAAMQSSYEVSGDRITIKYSPASAASLGVAQLAPLGLGRDEEVGLVSKTPGRDTEIGLNDAPAGQKAANAERIEELKFIVDGDLLVLTDSKANVTVYARDPEVEKPAAPDLSGDWTGQVSGAAAVPATVSTDAGKLTLTLEGGQGDFSGKFVQGVFVGKLQRSGQMSFAALKPTADGKLNGILLPDPYAQADIVFDFVPAAAETTAPPPAG